MTLSETLAPGAIEAAPPSATTPKDQYKTPRPLVTAVGNTFGLTYGFDLCAAPHSTVAADWYGWQPDGTFQDALGASLAQHAARLTPLGRPHAWCNPPYSKGMVLAFSDLGLQLVEQGLLQSVSFLVQNDCSTVWYWKLFQHSARKLDLAPRVVFLDHEDKPADAGARFASTVFLAVPSYARGNRPAVELLRWYEKGKMQPRG